MTALPALLAIDWGTSSLRGALLDAQGRIIDERASPRGLLSIAPGGWAAAFDAEFGPWLARSPELPCLMSGMVGSRQGWGEAPYCECPASEADLAQRLQPVRERVAIVPGVCCVANGVPDVMRGEETQVFGALSLRERRDATIVLPGTHSKWVRVAGGRIDAFETHMTGEVYALLKEHSILARGLVAGDAPLDAEAFDAGVQRAREAGGLLHHLFGVRTLALFERMSGTALASYLSGLLIGDELRAQAPAASSEIVLVGSAALTERYRRALALHGVRAQSLGAEATWRGLWSLHARRSS